ncbi:MAG TPA: DPP IV N-terminal domain-containing protein, partial [Longimicrobiaceae bacterium]|nr:DPP IV N-terminal domain-containing protein [Longimicrobiaceae bacterium]
MRELLVLSKTRRARLPLIALALLTAAPAVAQQAPQVTTADYDRAVQFLPWNTSPLVLHGAVRANWLPDGRFWYRDDTERGTEFVLVDPARGTRTSAFDQAKLAAALSTAADTAYREYDLPLRDLEFREHGEIIVTVGRNQYRCDAAISHCTRIDAPGAERGEVLSPDGTKAVFIRDWNLWVRDVDTGRETQLTTDGVEDFGYATDNAGWTHSDRAVVLWSPDSKKVATFQQDQRGVGEMYLVRTQVGHPTLQAWKYPLPGDSIVTMIQRVVIDVDDPKVVRFQMPPDQHRSTYCDDIACEGPLSDTQWSPDGSKVAFVSSTRDHKTATLRVADARTGEVRDVLSETVPTQYESGFRQANWHVLWDAGKVIWFSERDNWGHLYLYDLQTGKLLNQITTGSWPVLQLLNVDEDTGTLYFVAAGREPENPYYKQLYSVKLDGSGMKLLTPEPGDHTVSLSPDGRFFVDSYSTPQKPPVTVLRNAAGTVVMTLARADVSRLLATGWQPPQTIVV